MKWRKNKRMRRIIEMEDNPTFKGYKGVVNYRYGAFGCKMITPNDVEVYRERCKDDV